MHVWLPQHYHNMPETITVLPLHFTVTLIVITTNQVTFIEKQRVALKRTIL